ncbi:hypothetical protein RXV95_10915 [Novosphingobium sp. ZN18A2]|uniref:hypothetical protein n=1 Tax=Novosphingobium sp. ZN18A2 TaxID=3079861 RepID=UPI0030D33277
MHVDHDMGGSRRVQRVEDVTHAAAGGGETIEDGIMVYGVRHRGTSCVRDV